ncbi:hypothetical protein KKD91_03055, partial [Patescibacteria group bacterium]|nr:hypothetical protein [Patescibacteria group bacterium]
MKKISIKRAKKIGLFLAVFILEVVILSAVSITGVKAAFYEKINYQGKLTNSSGVAVADGTYCMKFRIMDALTVGNELWSETWTAADAKVSITSGLFSVLLGSHTAFTDIFNSVSLYLEVQLDVACDAVYEEVFAPRKQLGAVPAAFEAKKLAGFTWEAPGTIGSGTPNTGAFSTLSASGAITGASLDAGSGTITTTGAISAGNAEIFGNLTTTGTGTFGSVAIDGMTLDAGTWTQEYSVNPILRLELMSGASELGSLQFDSAATGYTTFNNVMAGRYRFQASGIDLLDLGYGFADFKGNAITTTGTGTFKQLSTTGSITAAAGVATANTFSNTLAAAANSDALTALLISPTFANGAHTTVTNNAIKTTSGAVWFDGAEGITPTSGAGTRLMWIPAKAAFRAGYV